MTYKMTDLATADRRRWLRKMNRDLAWREAFGPNAAWRLDRWFALALLVAVGAGLAERGCA